MFDYRGRAKWDAWNINKGTPARPPATNPAGMSSTEAQEKYISLVEKLATNYA